MMRGSALMFGRIPFKCRYAPRSGSLAFCWLPTEDMSKITVPASVQRVSERAFEIPAVSNLEIFANLQNHVRFDHRSARLCQTHAFFDRGQTDDEVI